MSAIRLSFFGPRMMPPSFSDMADMGEFAARTVLTPARTAKAIVNSFMPSQLCGGRPRLKHVPHIDAVFQTVGRVFRVFGRPKFQAGPFLFGQFTHDLCGRA